MADYLEVRGVRKAYGDYVALDDVSFSARRGEILALLGPSGCGKTTLLNMIAGFLMPDDGRILVDGHDLSNTPAHRRGMGMVFQGYALFPHMTIARNVAFGLEMRGIERAAIQTRVSEALAAVQLAGVEKRYPRELSGGQQQRVALARALVVRPAVLLLDEPLSNLDAILRKTMREDMRVILKEAGITAILVTHDHEEAIVTADRIILMSRGRVEQIASPMELYERPSTVFCAHFMDFTNLIDGVVVGFENEYATVKTAMGVVCSDVGDVGVGEDVTLAIRPENIAPLPDAGENHVVGRVARISYHGAVQRVDLDVADQTLVAHVPVRRCAVQPGDELAVSWRAAETRLLRRDAAAARVLAAQGGGG